jgi:predicted dehydrogenase
MTRWGFVATGGIAATLAREVALAEGARSYAVASRDAGRARAFAEEHGFERSYGSYEELLADDAVDVVYVATPHRQHHAVVRPALEAGRSVLCEKAFTCTLAATRDLVGLARERELFCMEAMWTRFQPLVRRLVDLVADGAVGEVQMVQADLGFAAQDRPADHRLWDPSQGGGAMLDLGVYPVSFAHMLLGPPETVRAVGSVTGRGVDASAGVLLGWGSGAHATLSASLTGQVGRSAQVVGTTGRIALEPPFHHPPRLVLHRDGREPEEITAAHRGRGYVHMVEHVQECLAQGRTESPLMPLDDTVAVMATLEEALHQLGVTATDEGFPTP